MSQFSRSVRGFQGRGLSNGFYSAQYKTDRKRKIQDLPQMFNEMANIHQHRNESGETSHRQNHWRGRNSRSRGFGDYNPNFPRWNTWETVSQQTGNSVSERSGLVHPYYEMSSQNMPGSWVGEGNRNKRFQECPARKNFAQRGFCQSRSDFGHRSEADLIHLSKTMSYFLRHGGSKVGLKMQPDGFVCVSELLQCNGLGRQFTEDDVNSVVRNDKKQRFQLRFDTESQKLMIRANQGHTIQVPDLELQRIVDASEAPVVIHGTLHHAWQQIQYKGLSRMSRNHIHFSTGKPGVDRVISGMRNTSEVLIYVNIKQAMEDGIEFFRSVNNVILSPGNENGFIPPKYFENVEYQFKGNKGQNTQKAIHSTSAASEAEEGCSKPKRRR